MKNKKKFRVQFLILLVTFFMSFAQASEINKKVAILIEKSGLKSMINFIPLIIQSEINQDIITEPNSDDTKFSGKILLKNMTAVKLQSEYEKYMSLHMNNDLVEAILKISDTPLLDRITQAEVAAAHPDVQGEMVTYFSKLTSNPPAEERIKIIQLIEEVSKSTFMMEVMFEKMIIGMSDAFSSSDDNKRDLSKELDQMRVMVSSQLKEQTIMQFHYIYRDFTNSELKEYIEFMKTDEFQKFMVVATSGIGHILTEAFRSSILELQKIENSEAA